MLFAPYSASSSQRQRNTNGNSSSQRRTTGGKEKKQPKKRTWTGQFICLSDRSQEMLPTPSERQVLYNAGLGLRKITFDFQDGENAVYDKLMEEEIKEDGETIGFPALKNSGGFEFLRCIPNCKALETLNCSLDVQSLKTCIGQGKIYIRPIQKSLSIIPLKRENNGTIIKEKCLNCFKEYSLEELRQHVASCDQNFESTDDENELSSVLANGEDVTSTLSRTTASTGNSQVEDEIGALDDAPVGGLNTAMNIDDQTNETAETAFNITHDHIPEQQQNENPNSDVIKNSFDLNTAITTIINNCIENKISSPVEILRVMQEHLVKGRSLEIHDVTNVDEGPTNFVMVDRSNLLETGLDEIRELEFKFMCLCVQFYGEVKKS